MAKHPGYEIPKRDAETETMLRQFMDLDGPKGTTDAYRENYDRVFSKKPQTAPEKANYSKCARHGYFDPEIGCLECNHEDEADVLPEVGEHEAEARFCKLCGEDLTTQKMYVKINGEWLCMPCHEAKTEKP